MGQLPSPHGRIEECLPHLFAGQSAIGFVYRVRGAWDISTEKLWSKYCPARHGSGTLILTSNNPIVPNGTRSYPGLRLTYPVKFFLDVS